MARFEEVFQRVVGHEGGYSKDPRDPGGETKFGISKRAHPWLDVKNLSLEGARDIYRAEYWEPLSCDELPLPIDEFVFDYAVNSGVECAALALQAAAGTLQDGRIGPKTVAAVRAKRTTELLRLLFVERAMTFALSPNDKTFGRGWFARLFDLTAQALRCSA